MKMRILFIIDGKEFGGGERVFLQIIKGLKSTCSVFAAATPHGQYAEQVRRLGVTFYDIDLQRHRIPKAVLEIKRIIEQNQIRIIHSQGARADFVSRLAGRFAKVDVNICTLAMPVEGFDVPKLTKVFYRFLDYLTEKYVDQFIVVSDFLRRTIALRKGAARARITRIYNGIELNQFTGIKNAESVRLELGLAQHDLVVGAIGRMVWQKGFAYLVKAMAQIRRHHSDIKLVLVGDGEKRAGLERLVRALHLENNVIFTGHRKDIDKMLVFINILAIPSLREGFPMVTLEAMAMGIPIVASDIEGIKEQITDGVNGLLVEPANHTALAGKIITLLGDRDLRDRLGRQARQTVEERFSVEEMIARTEKVYTLLLRKKAGLRRLARGDQRKTGPWLK